MSHEGFDNSQELGSQLETTLTSVVAGFEDAEAVRYGSDLEKVTEAIANSGLMEIDTSAGPMAVEELVSRIGDAKSFLENMVGDAKEIPADEEGRIEQIAAQCGVTRSHGVRAAVVKALMNDVNVQMLQRQGRTGGAE